MWNPLPILSVAHPLTLVALAAVTVAVAWCAARRWLLSPHVAASPSVQHSAREFVLGVEPLEHDLRTLPLPEPDTTERYGSTVFGGEEETPQQEVRRGYLRLIKSYNPDSKTSSKVVPIEDVVEVAPPRLQ